MDVIDDLVVAPFREIVEKGNIALHNAGGNDEADSEHAKENVDMLKSAEALVREGERALQRIPPLCKKLLDEYSTNFIEAIKNNDEIADFRDQLTDKLWEFDDYIEVDKFQPDYFTELRALSRKAAPRICDILRRMKLEPLAKVTSPLSPPSSPFVPHSAPNSNDATPLSPPPPVIYGTMLDEPHHSSPTLGRSFVPTAHSGPPDLQNGESVAAVTKQLQQMTAAHQDPSRVMKDLPPRPPSENPWDVGTVTQIYSGDEQAGNEQPIQTRRPIVGDSESPIDPLSPLAVAQTEARRFSDGIKHETDVQTSIDEQVSRHYRGGSTGSQGSQPPAQSMQPVPKRPRAPNINTLLTTAIPEHGPMDQAQDSAPQDLTSPYTVVPHPFRNSRQLSQASPLEVDLISPFDTRPTSNHHEARHNSQFSNPMFPPHNHASTGSIYSLDGLEVAPQNTTFEADYGPIPVETENLTYEPIDHASARGCTISSGSSFYLNKGFCPGATEVVRGGIGVKKIKKPVGFTTAATVARCTHCLYELVFSEIEFDVQKMAKGTYVKSGVEFRLRFLQKSHIPTKRVDDIMYGCVFCVHQGHTIDESDATVFFTAKTLMSHLARHPRPLPSVPGVRVIEDAEVPLGYANDFDVHFRVPAVAHPVIAHAAEKMNTPTGVGRETARRLNGQRLLPDRSVAHEFAQGARITGITWPQQHKGEWLFGWHDGVFASVPTDLVRLEPPPQNEMKIRGNSMIRAKAKWKFAPKDKGDWLSFNKDEIITNITYQYMGHWCWSGYNARGKWGIFPQSFIESNTVHETSSTLDRANTLDLEKNRSSSMFGRFSVSVRKASGRPESIAESTSSHDTTQSTSNFWLSGKAAKPGDAM